MRSRSPFIALAVAAAGMLAVNPSGPAITEAVAPVNETAKKRVRRQVAAGRIDPRWPKSKNSPTKRRLKRNRLHVSRRTKRKHRRAA